MTRTQPVQTAFSRPWFTACSEGRLLLQRCEHCGNVQFYPRTLCSHCSATAPSWHEASGRGTIASYTVVRRAVSDAYTVPYIVALIDLAEGPRLMSNIVEADPAQLQIGLPVQVRFEAWSEETTLPVFTLANSQEVKSS